jgi:hypothetical protein
MGGVATDYGQVMKVLLNDEPLRELMLIPTTTTVSATLDVNFIETVSSGIITTTPICRVILSSNPSMRTNNSYVKLEMLAIEVFVPNLAPNNKDRMPQFERRSNQIVDRILAILNNQVINGRKLRLESRNELASGTVGFCRHLIQMSYLRQYS